MSKILFCIALFTTTIVATEIEFTDESASLPSSTNASSMDVVDCDVDKDGDLDLILAMEFRPNLLLLNDGKGKFTEVSEVDGGFKNYRNDSEDIAISDYNKDSWPDIVFAAEDNMVHEYYINDGKGRFRESSFTFPRFVSNSVATADLNNDGWPDLVFGNAGPEKVFINDKNGGFKDESEARIPQLNDVTQDIKIIDINNDKKPDILAGNEDGNRIYINSGNGIFKDETNERYPKYQNSPDVETRKVSIADIDADGDPDLFYSNVAFIKTKDPQGRLFLNDGKGFFTDVTSTHFASNQVFMTDAIFIDIDNDRDVDLCTVNIIGQPHSVFLNDGKGKFMQPQSVWNGISGRGISIVSADLNGDKKNDFYIGQHQAKDYLLFRK